MERLWNRILQLVLLRELWLLFDLAKYGSSFNIILEFLQYLQLHFMSCVNVSTPRTFGSPKCFLDFEIEG